MKLLKKISKFILRFWRLVFYVGGLCMLFTTVVVDNDYTKLNLLVYWLSLNMLILVPSIIDNIMEDIDKYAN